MTVFRGGGYQYDVFISYRRVAKVQRWIDDIFLGQFRDHLELELGREPRIFLDRSSLVDGNIWKTEIIEALKTSKCLLAVLSKPYFGSPWCVAEWESFRIRSELEKISMKGHGLTIPIRWHDGESFPEIARRITTIDFRKYAITAQYFWQTHLAIEFEIELGRMCEALAKKIRTAPPHNLTWPVIDPEDVHIEDLPDQTWNYKLLARG